MKHLSVPLIAKIIFCKNCHSKNYIKAGIVRGAQRYECKVCHTHFTERDRRICLTSEDRLRAVRFCLMGVSLNAVAQMFFTSATSLRRWINEEKESPQETPLPNDERDRLYVKQWSIFSRGRKSPIKPGRIAILKVKLERVNVMSEEIERSIQHYTKPI